MSTEVQIKKSPAGHFVLRRKHSGAKSSDALAAAYSRELLIEIANNRGWSVVKAWS